jgi:hypothetical protein
MYHFLKKDLPDRPRLSILSHCFFELSSIFAQTDVNKQKTEMQKILKETLKNINFKQEKWEEKLKEQLETDLKKLNLDKQDEIVKYVVKFMHEIVQAIQGCDALKGNTFNILWSGLKEEIENLAKNKSSKICTNISNVRPKAKKEHIKYVVKVFKKAYNEFAKMRHYNKTEYNEQSNNEEYKKIVKR